MFNNKTICAISTAPGVGAIALIRLSGDEAIAICEKIFAPATASKVLSEQAANTLHFGTIKYKNEIIDEVVVAIFRAPYSYTGLNLVEISCHGSTYIQQKILQILIENGAKIAQPGEFTMQAFLNGKMDLSQAEGVADLIASTSEAAHRIAVQQLRGGFSLKIKDLRKQLLDFTSLIELELDFSEEDVEFANRKQLIDLVLNIKNLAEKLTYSFELGNAIKNGIPVAIVGEPNVEKSTLLNILLNEEKAIVSEFAGTTRDAIEDHIVLNGIDFRFIDTAGLRETTDFIESIGIEKAIEKIKQASIILYLIDYQSDINIIRKRIKELQSTLEKQKLILVINKIDKQNAENKHVSNFETILENVPQINISAKYNKNIDSLIETLCNSVNLHSLNNSDVIVSNIRHYQALMEVKHGTERIIEDLKNNISGEFLSFDIREVLQNLGTITGEVTNDEVLGNIFTKFCIGK